MCFFLLGRKIAATVANTKKKPLRLPARACSHLSSWVASSALLGFGAPRDDSFSSVHDFGFFHGLFWKRERGLFFVFLFYFEDYYVFTVFWRELHSTGSGS